MEKEIPGAAEGRECWFHRMVRESGTHKDTQEENTSPMPLVGKMRGADFCKFSDQWAQTLEF